MKINTNQNPTAKKPAAPKAPSAPVVDTKVKEDVMEFPETESPSTEKEMEIQDVIGVIGYYTDQVNYAITDAVPSDKAADLYKKLKDENLKRDPADRITDVPKLDKNLVEHTGTRRGKVKAEDAYSLTALRSLYTEDYKKLLAEGYVKVALAETKPSGFVLQNFIKQKNDAGSDEALRVNDKLTRKAAAYDYDAGTFLIKRRDLISFMATANCPELKVYNPTASGVGDPVGYILMKEKKSNDENKHNYDLVYVKREPSGMRNPVNSIYKLGIKYACNRDNQDPNTKGTTITKEMLDAGKVINADAVKELFGENYQFEKLGTNYGKMLSKTSSPLKGEAFDNLVKSTYIEYNAKAKTGYGKKFAEVSITPDMLTQLRSSKGTTSRRKVEYSEMLQDSVDAINTYLTYQN